MAEHPEFPGPGEHAGPDHIEAEAHSGPVPDGEMPGIDPDRDQRRRTLELSAVQVPDEGREVRQQSALRRTGTENDDLPRIHPRSAATEQRQDRSVTDGQREDTFDPAQDNAGPQSEQS